MEIADYVTVLRRGRVVGEDRIENLDESRLTRMMVAREVEYSQVQRDKAPGQVILNVDRLKVRGDLGHLAVKEASFDLRQGEIMAIAGSSILGPLPPPIVLHLALL